MYQAAEFCASYSSAILQWVQILFYHPTYLLSFCWLCVGVGCWINVHAQQLVRSLVLTRIFSVGTEECALGFPVSLYFLCVFYYFSSTIVELILFSVSQRGPVDIATGLWAWWNRVRILVGARDPPPCTKHLDWFWSPPNILFSWYIFLPPMVKVVKAWI